MKITRSNEEELAGGDVVSRFLHPGEFFFGESNCQIHTILGSCIAITLWHPGIKVGGMCHFVLPGKRVVSNGARPGSILDGRYADAAMLLFEAAVAEHGTLLRDYQAKIFGGSNMLKKTAPVKDMEIGRINTEAALRYLSDARIPLLVAHVGETGHRRIVFDVATGDVWVKHVLLQKIIPQG